MLRLHSLFSARRIRHILIPSIWTVAIMITVNDNFFEITAVDGNSMAPTLSPDQHATGRKDRIAWRKYQPTRNLKRGDVVNFGSPRDPEGIVVKRVIALEGDTVLLDPRRRPETSQGDCMESHAWDTWQGRAVVPEGHVWVEGDNWRLSGDSNWYGPISKSLITGKAIGLVWPRERFSTRPWEGWKSRTRVMRAGGMTTMRNFEEEVAGIEKG